MSALLSGALSAQVFAAEIIAHRGASNDAPENTLASTKLGYAQGADGGELDIHVSKDGKLVVIHDADTKRVAGVDKKVVDQTADELGKLDVGKWGDWNGKGFSEPIPTLDQVFPLVPKGKKLVIEIKCHSEALPPLEQMLRRSSLTAAQTILITFHYEVAEAAKKKFSNRAVYWLHDYKQDQQTGQYPDLDDLIAKAKKAGVDGLNLNHNFPLDAESIGRIKSAGLKIYVWTLDDTAKAKRLIEAGVDGITTNRPGAMRRELLASR